MAIVNGKNIDLLDYTPREIGVLLVKESPAKDGLGLKVELTKDEIKVLRTAPIPVRDLLSLVITDAARKQNNPVIGVLRARLFQTPQTAS